MLFRNDRHRYCIEPIGDTYGDGNAYANSDSYSHTYTDSHAIGYTHTDSHAIGYTHSHSHAGGHTYAYSYRYSYAYANSHIDAYGHIDAHGHTDAMHGKMFTDAEATSDSPAASHARRGDSCHAYSPSYTKRQARGGYSCCS